MRIIKLGGISFVFLFLIVTLISLLIPSHIRLSRATNLPNHCDSIFALIKEEKAWHPAYLDSTASSQMKAVSKRLIEQSDSTLVYRLQQEGRKPVLNGWQVYGLPTADSLTLQWRMDFQLGWWPWQKFSSLFYESTYGAMMEQGLANIKKRFMIQ